MPDIDDKTLIETMINIDTFASFDTFQITLRAHRALGDHFVVLEPAAWKKLVKFARQHGMQADV